MTLLFFAVKKIFFKLFWRSKLWIHFLAATTVLWITFIFIRKQRQKKLLGRKIAERKKEQELNFEWAQKNFEKLSQSDASKILDLSFFDLQRSLQNGSITPSDALRSYQRAAFEAHLKTNCVCLFIQDAVDIAISLEASCRDSNYSKPPLYGIPVSVKDCIQVKNMDSTQGLAQNLGKPSEKNSGTVDQLIRLGAIPFVHTNIPQALLSFGCSNPIYGRTLNPNDVTRVPGGSSGGEAALIALGGSPLGIGTDVGGSIRTPATFCGIAGFKSSARRVSHLGKTATIPGRQLVQTVDGPMAPNIDVCVEYLRLRWNDPIIYSSDVYLAPLRFQEDLFSSTKPLTIGFYTFDGYQEAPIAYQKAVLSTIELLQKSGHRCVPFTVPDAYLMFGIFCAGATVDGGLYLNQTLSKDIVPADCDIGFAVNKLPQRVQRIISKCVPNPRIRSLMQELPRNTTEMREMHEKIESYRHRFTQLFQDLNLDALVSPAFGSLPPRHGRPNRMISATSYTALYNLIDYAAGTVAVGRVTEEDDVEMKKMEVKDQWDQMVKDESQNCAGLPVSVQIATPPFREETCLRLLKFVEQNI